MLPALMLAVSLLTSDAPSTLPLPPGPGVPAAASTSLRSLTHPGPFDVVARFYKERFSRVDGVSLAQSGARGVRVLTIRSRRVEDTWSRVLVEETPQGTRIRITPMYRLEAAKVEAWSPPYVHIVVPRAPDAAKSAREIDHLELAPRRN